MYHHFEGCMKVAVRMPRMALEKSASRAFDLRMCVRSYAKA